MSSSLEAKPKLSPLSYRLLGLLPLIFFILHANYYFTHGGLPHLLWMCNIGNLVLAIGMLLDIPVFVRMAVAWLLPGLGLWIVTYVLPGAILMTSVIAHVGGLLIGLIALFRVRTSQWAWLHATLWFLFMQQMSRLFTPTNLNINVAHAIWPGWEKHFNSYWKFWLASTLVAAIGQWVLWLCLKQWIPPHSPAHLKRRPS